MAPKKKPVAKGLFGGKPQYAYLAKIVSIRSPSEARESVEKLNAAFSSATQRAKKVRVKRATVRAANIAEQSQKRKNLSEKERKELKKVAKIYREAHQGMKL